MAVPRSHTTQEQTQIYAALERNVELAGSCVARRNMRQFQPRTEVSTLRIFRTRSLCFKGSSDSDRASKAASGYGSENWLVLFSPTICEKIQGTGSLRKPSVVFMPPLSPEGKGCVATPGPRCDLTSLYSTAAEEKQNEGHLGLTTADV
ncbi:hypothetical protein J3458_009435 [Metarhizium acridum]|uniref:uncharacterized protein n=1 Tax=Metarhizium acridum TaxID=92637 RepID=UPI001C6C4FB0|nr:hypothetical protein J3458_009435 [Metarhizium acridum]